MPFEEQPARVAAAGHVPLGALCGHLLRRAQQHHTEVWAGVVGPDATGPQYAVLSAVEARPGVDQRTVGALASLDRSTTAQVVRRLETRGWLTRVTDPADRRRDLLGLTSSGAAQLRALHPRASIVQDRLLAPLSARERSAFVRDLAAVARVEDVPGAGHGPDARGGSRGTCCAGPSRCTRRSSPRCSAVPSRGPSTPSSTCSTVGPASTRGSSAPGPAWTAPPPPMWGHVSNGAAGSPASATPTTLAVGASP